MTSPSDRFAPAVSSLLDRLEVALDAEMTALAGLRGGGFDTYCRQKSRILLELSRLTRAYAGEDLPAALTARLSALRGSLERNQALLGLHLMAAQEVSDIISGSLREAESDGTYSAPFAAAESV